jgi:hypothetical protein
MIQVESIESPGLLVTIETVPSRHIILLIIIGLRGKN